MAATLIHVAVGVIQNPKGQVLIAKRPMHVHQGGLWEFPGGKVESGETVERALTRELNEELGINVLATAPLIQIRHDYGDKAVLLDVHWVRTFSGSARGAEGQDVRWVDVAALADYEFPAANVPIVKAIDLPESWAITPEYAATDADKWQANLRRLLASEHCGVIVRSEKLQQLASAEHLIHTLVPLLKTAMAPVMLNTTLAIFSKLQATFPALRLGLHLNRHALAECAELTAQVRVLKVRVGASCHNPHELQLAQQLQVDYALLSPLKPTASHPGAQALGMERFREWVAGVNVPVYALGGVDESALPYVRRAGGQGIAGISAFWLE